MNKSTKKNYREILNTIKNLGEPVGAIQISQMMSISQATVGRIMLRLEEEGLISKVSNKGRIITEKGIKYLNEENIRYSQKEDVNKLIETVNNVSKEMLMEVLEVRKLLEVKTVEMACINITKEDIDELENILRKHEWELKNGVMACDLDLQFHLSIAKISGNKTIYQILKLILTENNAYAKFSIVGEEYKDNQTKHHKEIIEAIKNKDITGAKKAIYKHLEEVRLEVEQYNTK